MILLFLPNVYSLCTLNFIQDSYTTGQNINAVMECSLGNERGVSYSVYWCDQSYNILYISNGTTPVTDIPFIESYIIPDGITLISANLTGTNLEGYDNASVTGATNTSLIITNVTFRDNIYIGKTNSVSYRVYDSEDNLVNGAYCNNAGEDGVSLAPLFAQDFYTIVTSGYVHASQDLSFSSFNENRDYLLHITCNYDSDGDGIIDKWGDNRFPFYVSQWLYVNTLTDKTFYEPLEEIFICANVTNIDYDKRITMEITHQLRCSAYNDNDSDTDRSIILSDDSNPDIRGISVNTTQMQCKRFIIPEARYMQGKNNTCYASTQVVVIDEEYNKVVTYDTTSPEINIYSESLQINADWQEISKNNFVTTINLSSSEYSDYSSNLTSGKVDIRIDKSSETIEHYSQYVIPAINFDNFINLANINSVNAMYCNGTGINYNLEYLNDGAIEIELQNVTLTNDSCYIVNMVLNNGENMLPITLGVIILAIFFIGMGIINNNKSRLSKYLRYSSMVIGYLQLLIISGLSYAYSIGVDVSAIMRANLWVVGLIGFGLFSLTLYEKSVDLLRQDNYNKKNEEW